MFMICKYNSDDFVEPNGKINSSGAKFLVMVKPFGMSLYEYFLVQKNDKSDLKYIIRDMLIGI
jgi:hypothetical protein